MAVPTHGALFITNPSPSMNLIENNAKSRFIARTLGMSRPAVDRLKLKDGPKGLKTAEQHKADMKKYDALYAKAGGAEGLVAYKKRGEKIRKGRGAWLTKTIAARKAAGKKAAPKKAAPKATRAKPIPRTTRSSSNPNRPSIKKAIPRPTRPSKSR